MKYRPPAPARNAITGAVIAFAIAIDRQVQDAVAISPAVGTDQLKALVDQGFLAVGEAAGVPKIVELTGLVLSGLSVGDVAMGWPLSK